MRDPDLVLRAQRAAAALERAWHRWSAIHGMGADPQPPVSSYVGYSLEEPWGQPRVVFGVNAEEAEQLAAILDGHDCNRLVEAAARAMEGGGQAMASASADRDWPAENGRVHVPAQAHASSGQRPQADRHAQPGALPGALDPLLLADAPTEFDWAALGSPGAPPWAVGVIDDSVLRESPLFRQAAAARRAAQVREAAERQTAHWEAARWEAAARAAAERDGAARKAAARDYRARPADGRGPAGRVGNTGNGNGATPRPGLPSAADEAAAGGWAQDLVPGLVQPAGPAAHQAPPVPATWQEVAGSRPPADPRPDAPPGPVVAQRPGYLSGVDRGTDAAPPEPPLAPGPVPDGQRRPAAAGWPDPMRPPVPAAWQGPAGPQGSLAPPGPSGWPAIPAAGSAPAGRAAGWPSPPSAAAEGPGWPSPPDVPAESAGSAVSAALTALEALSAAADPEASSVPSRSGGPCPPHGTGLERGRAGALPPDGYDGRDGTEQLQGLPPYPAADPRGGPSLPPAPVAGSGPGRRPSRPDPVKSAAFQPGAALSAYLDQGPEEGPVAGTRQRPTGADAGRPGGIVRGRSMPRLPWSRRNGGPADHDGAENGTPMPQEPGTGGNGGSRSGPFPTSADVAGWTSGELPGQAAPGDAAW